MAELAGKVAIVTGGGGAIGRAICLGLAREGARVVACDLDQDKARETASLLGPTALALQTDVSRGQDVDRLMEETVRHFGRLDILVNNAGICPRTPVLDMDEEEWDLVLDTNLRSVFLCSRGAARIMKPQGGGRIVNITSGRGVTGRNGAAHYAASKGGINGFTRSLGMEWAPYGINVNALAPGRTDTPMLRAGLSEQAIEALASAPPDKRVGQPEDVVGTVIYLCSEASQTMYGQIIYMKTP
ncbi:MAG: SDR family oxidoreductase [Dehalococcoidia bacterium]|nr:SDR family oxidoreductase [Dehalococcoidia bacterium]